MNTTYLIDTSALVRVLRYSDVRENWSRHIDAGLIAYCNVIDLEITRSVRSPAERKDIRQIIEQMLSREPMPDRVFTRACQVQQELVDLGQNRGPGPVHLLLAATAESTGLSVLHYDADFKYVAKVTNQPMRWLAPRGSID